MNVDELIALLQKVNVKAATVFLHHASDSNNVVEKVIVEHDVGDGMIRVILKTDIDN